MTMPPPPLVAVAEPERPARPAVVTAAGYLLFLLATLQLVSLAGSIPTFNAMRKVYPEIYKGTPIEDSTDKIVTFGIVFGVGLVVIMAAAFITLGILDLKGKQAARIVTWVVVGLLSCCSVVGAASGGLNLRLSGGQTANGVDPAEVQRQMEAALPGWVHPFSVTVSTLQALTAILVIIFLALPAANAYFRKPAPNMGWTPPYPTV
jgi:hypothetical protein